MRSARLRSAFLLLTVFALPGCANIVGALFGSGVAPGDTDSSPPEVRILVASTYLRQPDAGDFVVTRDDQTAWTHPFVHFAAIADDPQGVRFVEVMDIVVEPSCSRIDEGRDGRPPAPPTFLAAPAMVLPGSRIDTPPSSATATTRIPLFDSVSLTGGAAKASRYCPPDRPWLGRALVRVRARAGNFGSDVSYTGVATFTLTRPSTGGLIGGAPIGGSPGSGTTGCTGEGSACTTHPSECPARGEDWEVPGTIECRRGEPVCVADRDEYCTGCGGDCGACAGQSCSASSPCAPGAICIRRPRLGGSDEICSSLLVPEPSTGNRPCTPLSGFCWLPNEAGQAHLICSEGQ